MLSIKLTLSQDGGDVSVCEVLAVQAEDPSGVPSTHVSLYFSVAMIKHCEQDSV